MKIEEQITDAIVTHDSVPSQEAKARVPELLRAVGLPEQVAKLYPHELSGGLRQRVAIAGAVALKPKLIIADEPTTALDVTIQRIILQTLKRVKEELGATIIVVTHDMQVHAQLANRLVIMYAGKVVEIGAIRDLFYNPLHPYSQGLIATIPSITGERKRLAGIPGAAPSPLDWPVGCRFHPRCDRAKEECAAREPQLLEVRDGHFVACHLWHGAVI
jgi:oligopeptide/dipeptide ABC transporter ATP-binding protein